MKTLRCRSRKPTAFTLVEVVISISITAVLMVALWSLLTMYINVSTRSEKQTAQTQLVRSIQQQIESDLKQVSFLRLDDDQPIPVDVLQSSGNIGLPANAVTASSDDAGYDAGFEDDRPRFSSSYADGEKPENVFSIEGDLIYALTDERWFQPNVGFTGNSFGLILDQPFRAEPRRDRLPSVVANDDFQMPVPPSEVLARTVYVFVDRAEALTKGFPPGLLRVTFLPKELQRIRNESDSHGDLFQVLEKAKPDLFKKTEYTEAWHDEESAVKDVRTAALEQLNRSLGRVRLMEHDFVNRIDYLPEVSAFRLRFFDGESWADDWDAESEKGLPVAAELSFEVDVESSSKFESDFARLSEEFTFQDLQAEELASAEVAMIEDETMNLDSEIRTAQTAAFVPPNQYLIYLGPSGLGPTRQSMGHQFGDLNNGSENRFTAGREAEY